MDTDRIVFKSTEQPDFKAEHWCFYFKDMRAYNKLDDSWYRFRLDEAGASAQLYPHGFFWKRISNSNESIRQIQEVYAEYVLLLMD